MSSCCFEQLLKLFARLRALKSLKETSIFSSASCKYPRVIVQNCSRVIVRTVRPRHEIATYKIVPAVKSYLKFPPFTACTLSPLSLSLSAAMLNFKSRLRKRLLAVVSKFGLLWSLSDGCSSNLIKICCCCCRKATQKQKFRGFDYGNRLDLDKSLNE